MEKKKFANLISLENGWHPHEMMKNGKPRPSAVRDFPRGIVPIHLKKVDGLDFQGESSDEMSQLRMSPTRKQDNGKCIKDKFQKEEQQVTMVSSTLLTDSTSAIEKDERETKPSVSNDLQVEKGEDASISKRKVAKDVSTEGASSQSEMVVEDVEVTAAVEKISIDQETNAVLSELQNAQQPEVETEAMDVEHKEHRVQEEKVKNVSEQSKQTLPVKRKSGIRDMPEKPGSKQENLIALSQTKNKDVKEEKPQKVIEKKKYGQPLRRKSGIRDMPGPLSEAKNKKLQDEVRAEHIAEDLEIKTTPSKVAEGSQEGSKPDSAVKKKKRPLEEPDSSEKVKKMRQPNEVQTPLKAKEKEPKPKTQRQVATPKPAKKVSTPGESPKRVRRSAKKPATPATAIIHDAKDARKLILESLRLYDAARRKFVQDEEIHGKQTRGSRADLQAASLLKDHNVCRINEKRHGPLPGVYVGDIFLFRTELSFARVHGPIQGGIEYLTTKDSEFNAPVAISIISNVGQDDEDNGEELIYTGQGGRSADNKQIAHQKLERGNLAMDGSRKFKVPVRVLRGIKDAFSPTGKIYVYDGLYNVEETYTEKGSGGFDEFKFKLLRMPDQAELGSNTLKVAADLKSQALSSRKHLTVVDISKGIENQAICVENRVDDNGMTETEFMYSTELIFPDDLQDLEPRRGCKCNGACSPSNNCSCFTKNGDEFPYLNGGALVRQKDFIFECGKYCSCSSSCRNRAPEKGSKFRLEVFKTMNKGWGVRALDIIPAGSFITEFIGKVIIEEQRALECPDRKHMLFSKWLPEGTPRWGDITNIISEISSSAIRPDAGKPDLVIDASHMGNVSRFINHSCSPNLFFQKVLSEHENVRYPHFKLFAIDNIPPLTELTFDYGCPPPEEQERLEEIECLCEGLDCRGKLYV
ncbi:hypothetical protein KP509_02G055100 [Ceratopteris richardii]|nr:hypothetical protein KP509_02G055100 [Ceratopteris richardii]